MSSNKRGSPAPAGMSAPPRAGGSGQRAGGARLPPPPPPPSTVPSVASEPSGAPGGAGDPRRREWAAGGPASQERGASRPASRLAGASARSPQPPDLYSRSTVAQLVDTSVKNPELKLQLLTRALEESRMRTAHALADRDAVADALAALCRAAGAKEKALVPPAGGEDLGGDDPERLVLPCRLDLLSTQLRALQEELRARDAAVAAAEAAHERAALQVVAQQQHCEALERQLEEARYAAQQQAQTEHAMATKVRLLEEQAAATAESARRRMEQQLEGFRGDAATARSLQAKFTELERQLEEAQRDQYAEADAARRLGAQAERLQARLKEAHVKQAELSQQLWDKSAALNDLTAEHRGLSADAQGLRAELATLRDQLEVATARAQRAEDLGVSLQAQCRDGLAAQAALAEEVERLRSELQQEREDKHRLHASLAEEQLAGAAARAALQGRGDELASLLGKLDEYSNRIVSAEVALEGSNKRADAATAAQRSAEEAARTLRHENAALQDSLADLAAGEARWREQLAAAEGRLADSAAALAVAQGAERQAAAAAAAAAEHAQQLGAALAERDRRLEGMAALQAEADSQRQQAADLKAELRSAAAAALAVRAEMDELAEAKQGVERELRKQQVLVSRLQEQTAKQAGELRAATKEAREAQARADATAAAAAEQRERHEADTAAALQAHAERKARNERLEHDNRQQAIIIAELQATASSSWAQLAATLHHNAALHRYAVAHGAAYGRLAAHAAGLHQQLARQLGTLRQLCRHLGLQLAAALAAADPVAALKAGVSSISSSGEAAVAGAALQMAAGDTLAPSNVAAAVLAIESLRTELQVSLQLLNLQEGSGEARQLAAVPAGVAEALAADLAGLPAELLSSPRLELAGPPAAANRSATPSPAAPPAAVPLADGLTAAGGQAAQPPSPATRPPAAQAPLRSPAASARQPPPPASSSALSAQVAQMESFLERLVGSSAEQAARTAAATQLHQQEQAARQRAQELAAELAAQLVAVQADLSATRGQRDELAAQSRRLARELRDAIYSLGQLHAEQQGKALSWAVRGLQSSATQTSYCRLWEAHLGGSAPRERGSSGSDCDAGSVLCSNARTSSGSSSDDSSVLLDGGAAAAAGAAAGAALPPRVLPLAALQREIRELYRAKAVHDLSVARTQRAFTPLSDFLASHLALQCGAQGEAVTQRAEQLQASVEAHAGVHEVAMFGLAAGMLEEAEPPRGSSSIGGSAGPACTALVPATTAAGAAVPQVLYHRRRPSSSSDALPSLRRFCAGAWHAAYARSAARPPLPQPFSPAGADYIHAMASEVHNLALGVPGVEQLMVWVLSGGLGACLPALDLGLQLAENQVPQLYLLAVESCRLLGLHTTPQIYVRASGEAAAYYLLLPADARLHGLNGSSADAPACTAAAAAAGGAAAPPSRAASPGSGLTLVQSSSMAALEGLPGGSLVSVGSEVQEWRCAVVLTSGLVDLLEPEELQGVLAGCLAFHAALCCPAGAGSGGGGAAPREAAQLAVLCRSVAALGTLGALSALCPDALAARLPRQMGGFFTARIQPLLRRALRYLSLYCDRVGAAAVGGWRPLAAAAVKQACGATLLRNELRLDAVLAQAAALEEAAAEALPAALLREEGATLGAAAPSLPLLRVRELRKWWEAQEARQQRRRQKPSAPAQESQPLDAWLGAAPGPLA